MKNFIGIAFVMMLLSVLLIPLSDAASGDIWKECTSAIKKQTKIEGGKTYTCCDTNAASATYTWTWVNQVGGDDTSLCDPPDATFDSPPTGWQGPSGGSFFVLFTFQADNGLTTCEWRVLSYNGASWVQTFPASGWYNFICSGTSPVSTSDSLEMGAGDECGDSGNDRCKLELRVSDGLNTVTSSQLFDVDIVKPNPGTYTMNGKSSGIVYSKGTLNHVWSGFSDPGAGAVPPDGSGLSSFEIWRATYNPINCNEVGQGGCNWALVPFGVVKDPASDSWSETISGDFMYGWHSSDNVANWIKESTPIAVRYDTTINPPTYNTPQGKKFKTAPTLDIDFSDNFGLKEMHYQFNGVGGTWTQIDSDPSGATYNTNWAVASSDWNPLPDGTHYIYFKIIDEATPTPGNTHQTANNAAAFKIIKDTTPPDTNIDSGPFGDVSDTSATFTFSSTEPDSTFECRLDVGAFSPCKSPMPYSGLPQGPHTFAVRAADEAGNTDLSPASESWTVDTISPTKATGEAPVHNTRYNSATMPTTFSGKAKDNTGGTGLNANSVMFYIKRDSDNKYWTGSIWSSSLTWLATTHSATSGDTEITWTDNVALPSWADGTYRAKARATDKAANPFDGSEISFIYDTTPPVITITSVGGDSNGLDGYITTDTTPDIILGTNEQANCRYSTTSGTAYDSMTGIFSPEPPTTATSHTTTLPILSPGTYDRYARCKDTVDNKNTNHDEKQITFTICTKSNPTLKVNPPASQKGEPGDAKTYSLTVTNNDNNCGTETFDLTAGCPAGWTCTFSSSSLPIASGSSASATLSLTSPASATTGINVINVEAKNQADTSFKNSASATYEIVCIYRLSIKPMTNFNLATKHGDSTAVQNTWAISLQDTGSSSSCPLVSGKLEYSISSTTASGSCHSQTGIYSGASTPPGGLKPALPFKFSVAKNGDSNNAFKVFVKRQASNFCTISFNIVATQPGTMQLDPSFTVGAPGVSTQPPQVSFFDFSGDSTVFKVDWEAFYPDEPFRTMKVECGLNCDPRIGGDCTAANEKCEPYPFVHGTEEIKKGSCSVSSPTFNFATDKVMCLFYDPVTPSSNTFINHGFTAVDFDVKAADKVTTSVGHPFELKIDVANKGKLTDSYRVDLTAPATIDASPATITTPAVEAGKLVSAFAFVTPLVEQSDKITVKVTSLTSNKVVTKDINVNPGLFALPEFGLTGFLQIIAIAAIVYLILINRKMLKLKKKRRR